MIMYEIPNLDWQRQVLKTQFLQAASQDFYSEAKLNWAAVSSWRESKGRGSARKNRGKDPRHWSRLHFLV